MTREELIGMRIEFLKQFDTYVRENDDDEESGILDYWLICGVPDESTEDDLYEIAKDTSAWIKIVKAFEVCVKNISGEWR